MPGHVPWTSNVRVTVEGERNGGIAREDSEKLQGGGMVCFSLYWQSVEYTSGWPPVGALSTQCTDWQSVEYTSGWPSIGALMEELTERIQRNYRKEQCTNWQSVHHHCSPMEIPVDSNCHISPR